MRVFFNQYDSSLYVIPYRCGSTYIKNMSDKFDLFSLETKHSEQMDVFKSLKVMAKNKTIFYRDPFEKFISYYHKFIFKQDKISHLALANINTKFGINENIWQDIFLKLEFLEKNIEKDEHTRPISKYFETHSENPYEYDIISMSQYQKFWMLRDKSPATECVDWEFVPKNAISILDINFKDLQTIFSIYEWVKRVYKEDYELGKRTISI